MVFSLHRIASGSSIVSSLLMIWTTAITTTTTTKMVVHAANNGNNNGLARGKLYSTNALNLFCQQAQQIVATTTLEAQVEIYDELEDFISSDATPYREDDGALEEPLPHVVTSFQVTSQQENEYVQGILCKLKSADGLNDAYPGLGAIQSDCSAVNEAILDAVYDSLTAKEQGDAEETTSIITNIVFDTWLAYSGLQWTDGTPNTPFAYTTNNGQTLHLVAKELYVSVNNPFPFIGNEKKGVDYCQLPSALHILKLITGQVIAPECDPPPEYNPLNPFDLPSWDCENP